VRFPDTLWERVLLAAADEGRSASQLVAAAVRAYVEGGAVRAEETGGAMVPANAAPGLAQAPSVPAAPVAAVRPWRRSPADEAPQPLERVDTCRHPAAARRSGVGVVRHCGACGAPLGLTGTAG
jgi:hypothetical protein